MGLRDRLGRSGGALGWRNAERFAPAKRLDQGVADHFAPAPRPVTPRQLQKALRKVRAERARRASGG